MKKYIRDFMPTFSPKSPSPRTQISKEDHDKIYNQGWNDAMQYKGACVLK